MSAPPVEDESGAFSDEGPSRDTLALPFRTDAGVKGKDDADCSTSVTSGESCKSTLDDVLDVS
jgi:hypothetical protein